MGVLRSSTHTLKDHKLKVCIDAPMPPANTLLDDINRLVVCKKQINNDPERAYMQVCYYDDAGLLACRGPR